MPLFRLLNRLLRPQPGIVLALGGGGARGLAHIGVLEVLEENGIVIKAIAGTSVGAIVGALYAETNSATETRQRVEALLESPAFRKTAERNWHNKNIEDFWGEVYNKIVKQVVVNIAVHKLSLADIGSLEEAIQAIVLARNFEDLKLPFVCTAVDLKTGIKHVFSEGNLKAAVIASSAIPGFLQPYKNGDMLLSDGAIKASVPTLDAIHLGRPVVAVDVRQTIERQNTFNNAFDIIVRAGNITADALADYLTSHADLVIAPEVGTYNWSDFADWSTIVRRGREAAIKVLPQLKAHAI
jgi:NTE family protein